jgi:transcriptional regulator GlxA family with amidase domain
VHGRSTSAEAIARLHGAGAIVATVCTGGMLAARAGITAGRPATTHHSAIEDLRACGAEIVSARVIDDGDLISSGG